MTHKPPAKGSNVLYWQSATMTYSARVIEVEQAGQADSPVMLIAFPTDRAGSQFVSREHVPYGPGVVGCWGWNEEVPQVATKPSYIAGQTIAGHRVCTLDSQSSVVYAQPDRYQEIIGLSLNAANVGEEVAIVLNQVVAESSWIWQPNQRLFLGVDGTLTQFVPTTDYLTPLGVALSVDTILFTVHQSILRVMA